MQTQSGFGKKKNMHKEKQTGKYTYSACTHTISYKDVHAHKNIKMIKYIQL